MPSPTRASSKRKLETETPKQSTLFYDDDGDLELISADDVVFKLERYHLQASSPVFRDTIKLGTAGNIRLSDNRLESAQVIEQVLAVVINGRTLLDIGINLLPDLMDFLRKYEMDSVIALFKLQLESAILYDKGDLDWEIFERALHIGNPDTCSKAIIHLNDREWHENYEGGWTESVEAGRMLDLRNMPYCYMKLIPMPTLWALLRASVTATQDGEIDAEAMSYEYERLMDLPDAKKYTEQ